MKFKDIIATCTRTVKKHSPEILVASGIVGMVGAAVLACKETLHVENIIDEHKKQIDICNEALKDEVTIDENDTPQKYDEKMAIEDKTKVYTRTAVALFKNYIPSVGLGALSIASILYGFKIIKGRHVATIAAYTALQDSFTKYRDYIRENHGEETDANALDGRIFENVIAETEDENGNRTVSEEIKSKVSPAGRTYCYLFDENSVNWDKRDIYNRTFLHGIESNLNMKLSYCADGTVTLAEALEMVGIPKTPQSLVTGWVRQPGDPRIQEGGKIKITIIEDDTLRETINNEGRPSYWISFNCDGLLYDVL